MDQAAAYRNRWRMLAVLIVSLLVVVLDNSILNVALPTISRDLRATNSQLIWAVDAYSLVFASLLFTWGVLGDRFGRRRVLITGLVMFGISSALCAYSSSPEVLIGLRALMAVGGAAVLPVTLAIITNVFPPDERPRAIGIWAGAVGAAIAVGPITGGVLLEHFWWGSVFLINVPVVIVGITGIVALVPESRGGLQARIDPIGVVLSIVGLLLLVYGIVHGGETKTWSDPAVWGSILAGLAVLAAFGWLEWRSDHPSLDIHLFSNREFSMSLIAVTLTFFGLMGATFFMIFYLQTVRGMSPLQAGLALLPLAVGQVVTAARSDRLTKRFGPRVVIGSGMAVVSVAFLSLIFLQVDSPLAAVLSLYLAIGIGMGAAMAPATATIMSTLPLSRAGAGSAVQNTVRQLGGALGVAILGTVVSVVYSNRFDTLLPHLPAPAQAASTSVETAHAIAQAGLGAGLIDAQQYAVLIHASNAAFMSGLHIATVFTAITVFLGATVAFVGLPHKAQYESALLRKQHRFHEQVGTSEVTSEVGP